MPRATAGQLCTWAGSRGQAGARGQRSGLFKAWSNAPTCWGRRRQLASLYSGSDGACCKCNLCILPTAPCRLLTGRFRPPLPCLLPAPATTMVQSSKSSRSERDERSHRSSRSEREKEKEESRGKRSRERSRSRDRSRERRRRREEGVPKEDRWQPSATPPGAVEAPAPAGAPAPPLAAAPISKQQPQSEPKSGDVRLARAPRARPLLHTICFPICPPHYRANYNPSTPAALGGSSLAGWPSSGSGAAKQSTLPGMRAGWLAGNVVAPHLPALMYCWCCLGQERGRLASACT